jgi:hypothetical protein
LTRRIHPLKLLGNGMKGLSIHPRPLFPMIRRRGATARDFCLIGLLVTGTLVGCSRPAVSDYVPLVVGSIREYRMEVSEPGKGKQMQRQIHSGTVISRYAEVERINNKDYIKVLTFHQGLPGMGDFVHWIRCAPDGLYQIIGNKDNQERLLIPLPPRVGQSWTTEDSDGKEVGSFDATETVDLPDRTFPDCVRIRIERHDNQDRVLTTTTFWLAKGNGFVKAESEALSNGAKTKTWLAKVTSAK